MTICNSKPHHLSLNAMNICRAKTAFATSQPWLLPRQGEFEIDDISCKITFEGLKGHYILAKQKFLKRVI